MKTIISSDKIKIFVQKTNDNFSDLNSNKVDILLFNGVKNDLTNKLNNITTFTGIVESIHYLTGTTLPNNYLSLNEYITYTGNTNTTINGKLEISSFTAFTNSSFNTYWTTTGNTNNTTLTLGSYSGYTGGISFINDGKSVGNVDNNGFWKFKPILDINTSSIFSIFNSNNDQIFSINNNGFSKFGTSDTLGTAFIHILSANSSNSSLRLESGNIEPSSPNEGDMWNFNSELKFYSSGITKSVLMLSTTASTANTGSSSLPANPEGFITIFISGIGERKIPFYNI